MESKIFKANFIGISKKSPFQYYKPLVGSGFLRINHEKSL